MQIDAVQSQLNELRSVLIIVQQQSDIISDTRRIYPSRPMSKSELAAMLGKSTRQLSKWINPFRQHLREMGVTDRAKILPANAVLYICSELDITLHEENECVNRTKPN